MIFLKLSTLNRDAVSKNGHCLYTVNLAEELDLFNPAHKRQTTRETILDWGLLTKATNRVTGMENGNKIELQQ